MKIVYLIELDFEKHIGVKNKVLNQVKQLKSLGVKVDIYVISPRKQQNFENVYFINVLNVKKEGWIGRVYSYFNRCLCVYKLDSMLKSKDPDVIYYREGFYFPGLGKILDKKPVIVEVNQPINKKGIIQNFLISTYIKMQRKFILRKADGFVAISNEIKISLGRSGYKKPTTVICNGIALNKYKNYKTGDYKENLDILMIGSPNQNWQGFDHFIEMASLATLNKHNFHLVGPTISQHNLPPNMKCYGFLGEGDVDKLYEKVDVCVGSLACYRKGIYEVSSLKHREYLSKGLPFICSVIDSDFSGLPYVLTLQNNSDCIISNEKLIYEFIESNRNVVIQKKDLVLFSEEEKAKSRFKILKAVLDD